jgi:hypothetical protein
MGDDRSSTAVLFKKGGHLTHQRFGSVLPEKIKFIGQIVAHPVAVFLPSLLAIVMRPIRVMVIPGTPIVFKTPVAPRTSVVLVFLVLVGFIGIIATEAPVTPIAPGALVLRILIIVVTTETPVSPRTVGIIILFGVVGSRVIVTIAAKTPTVKAPVAKSPVTP